MLNLIRADLKRVVKDKLFLICSIIALAFAIINPLLYEVLFSMAGANEQQLAMLGVLPTAKSLFFQSFLPGNNFGLIMPILLGIVLCKDFSYGTIRNKLIAGHSRAKVFLSMLITCIITMCGIMLVQGIVTLGISLIFYEYSTVAFSLAEFGYVLISLLFEILIYITISAILCFLCVFMKNSGVCAVVYIAIAFLLSIIGGVFLITTSLVSPEKKALIDLLDFLAKSNIFSTTIVGAGTSYSLKEVLYILIPNIVSSALLITFGILVFNKKDLK